jgi:hypothetical protein
MYLLAHLPEDYGTEDILAELHLPPSSPYAISVAIHRTLLTDPPPLPALSNKFYRLLCLIHDDRQFLVLLQLSNQLDTPDPIPKTVFRLLLRNQEALNPELISNILDEYDVLHGICPS